MECNPIIQGQGTRGAASSPPRSPEHFAASTNQGSMANAVAAGTLRELVAVDHSTTATRGGTSEARPIRNELLDTTTPRESAQQELETSVVAAGVLANQITPPCKSHRVKRKLQIGSRVSSKTIKVKHGTHAASPAVAMNADAHGPAGNRDDDAAAAAAAGNPSTPPPATKGVESDDGRTVDKGTVVFAKWTNEVRLWSFGTAISWQRC